MKTGFKEKIKWPPNLKKEFKRAIEKQIRENRLSHAYLLILNNEEIEFARHLAKILLCQSEKKPCNKNQCCRAFDLGVHPDFIYLKRAEEDKEIKIEATRELKKRLALKANNKRVIFIENAHELNQESANALLKSIEEPGKNNIFILTTDDQKKILPTISSRCQIYFLKNYLDRKLSDREKMVKNFLNSDLVKKFYIVEKIAKSKQDSSDFLLQLELYYRERILKEDNLAKSQILENLRLLARGRDLLKRNISVRLLLENISLHLSPKKGGNKI